MASPDVIAALETALVADPENVEIRHHLVGLLVAEGEAARALDHLMTILSLRPDDLAALTTAGSCCRTLGDDARAESFERIAAALGAPRLDPEPRDAPGEAPRPSVGIPGTADDLLELWEHEQTGPVEPEIGEMTASVVTLADVGGLPEVKARLDRTLFAPMRHPEIAAQFGARVRGGLVLYGPPGCGKTYLARAVAGELGARFYSVGLADVLDMWMGASERNISNLFDVARAHAPCVLFLDEVDALGMRRTQLRSAPSMRTVVNQLLAELDGVSSDNEGVFLLAATNHPWDVDPALLRPGRLGHLVFVPPPDLEARAPILWAHVRDRPRDAQLDVWQIAHHTDGYSGADLREICDQAAEAAMSASLARGGVVPLTTADLQHAATTVRPSVAAWVDTARNVAVYSNTDGQYDDLAAWIRGRRSR